MCDGGGAGGKGLSKKEKERTHRHGQQCDYCRDGGKKTQNFGFFNFILKSHMTSEKITLYKTKQKKIANLGLI